MNVRSAFLLPPFFFLLLAVSACGKKGAPLAPFVRVPAAVDQITARRVGNDVYVSVTVPPKNIDNSTPVAISRVEIFGYTGRTPPPPRRWAELGTLIARVPVTGLPPGTDVSTLDRAYVPREGGSNDTASGPASAYAAPATAGTVITVRDRLTPDNLEPAPLPLDPAARKAPAVQPVRVSQAPVRRFYMAFAFSPRERPSMPGAFAEI